MQKHGFVKDFKYVTPLMQNKDDDKEDKLT